MNSPTPRRSLGLHAVLAAAVVTSACGMRGAPLPPLVIVPETPPLSVTRLDDEVYIAFDMPSQNSDGSVPVDLDRMELYALTTHPDPDKPVSLALDDWLDLATLVATIPAPEEDGRELSPEADATVEGEADEADADDAVTVRVPDVVILEILTPEVRQPIALDEYREDDESEHDEPAAPRLGPLMSRLPTFPRRSYRAVAISTRGREAQSAPAEVTLAAPTEAPGPPSVSYTETDMLLEWVAPATARVSVQATMVNSVEYVLPSTPIVEFGSPSTYRVYAFGDDDAEDGEGPSASGPPIELEPPRVPPPPTPLNLENLSFTTFLEPTVEFGANRCYVVRTVDRIGGLEVVGRPSGPTCVVPVDTFPPSAPSDLIAVASEGAISLVWDASPEADVVGYLVLRGDAPGATLERLTPEAVVETSYRDATVVTDRRYVYVVQAVDGAEPPNLSPPSSEATEQAR